MRLIFLNHNPAHRRLILIFPGWSTTPAFYSGLAREGWDLAVAEGYEIPELDTSPLGGYSTVYVYAWSLGVFMAALVLKRDDYTAAFAINGTERPVDDSFGIPLDIFQGTADNLDTRNLAKFRLRMAGSRDNLALLQPDPSRPDDIPLLRSQLDLIRHISQSSAIGPRLDWNRAYISSRDRIFPPGAQSDFWATRNDVPAVCLDSPHLPDFRAIIDSTIPDLDSVAQRFREALPTYDDNAAAQRIMARRLLELVASQDIPQGGQILELGQGSGLFTRLYGPLLSPARVDFIDLYPTGRFGIAPDERYFTGDAERFLDESPAPGVPQYDAILSASCIQWFVNPALFFANAAKSLRPAGILAFSTFAPGNLRELDSLRPTPLSYPDPRNIEASLRRSFPSVTVLRQSIPLDFPTKRHLLRHIKLTGVGGASRISSAALLKMIRTDDGPCRLTYEALYAVAKII